MVSRAFAACALGLVLTTAVPARSEPPPSAALPVPPSPQATLRWKESSPDVYGFVVLRSEERGGPFLRINGPLVRSASPDGAVQKEYVYVDRDVRPGRTYYYALTAVLGSGAKQRMPGVRKKTIEGPAKETAREAPAPSPPD